MDLQFIGCDVNKIIIMVIAFIIAELIRWRNSKEQRKMIIEIQKSK